jgi:uncharacterized protein YukE
VAALTPADVKRWDADAIHSVFQTATNRAATLQRLGDSLQQVHNNLSDWQGEAGDAFSVDLGKTRRDIDADGQESKQVAAAVSRAEADVRSVKSELDGIDRAAEGYGWAITSDWRIDPGNTMIGLDRVTLAAEQQLLQGQLDTCKLHAHNADQELATAVRGSVGDIPLDATGHQPGAAPPAPGAPKPPILGQPKSLQDMLLPAGPASPGPGGAPPKGPPVPAGAGGGKPPSLEDMMLGRGEPADPGGKPPPGSLPDLLSRLGRPGAPGAPALRLNPADVESFKAMARQTMIKDGVPPDQIEAKLNAVVANTQQWMDNGMPKYVPPEGPRPPPPGFGEGFGDRWFATEQGIKNLIGQGGPGAPGVLQSWEQMLKGTLETAQNPMGAAMGELQHAVDSPSLSYYLGEKGADAAFTAPTLMFGGEGAGIGRIADADALAYSPVHSPHAPVGFDSPIPFHSWSEDAASDLNNAFWHGEPTTTLSGKLADLATHYIGDNPDRVVLGKFEGYEGGYIGEARENGGIYFDTGQDTWATMGQGFSRADSNALGWQVNESFLRSQMESGVPRIDYVVDPSAFSSVEEVLALRPDSFSAMEITFLKTYGDLYGYQQVGDSWVRVADGAK